MGGCSCGGAGGPWFLLLMIWGVLGADACGRFPGFSLVRWGLTSHVGRSLRGLIAGRFAQDEALHEIYRVLKPGGCLGLIWNIEDCV